MTRDPRWRPIAAADETGRRARDPAFRPRKFAAFDKRGKISDTKPWRREDGLMTRNFYGYDMADLVCQACVLDQHERCSVEPHDFSGYSGCICNPIS